MVEDSIQNKLQFKNYTPKCAELLKYKKDLPSLRPIELALDDEFRENINSYFSKDVLLQIKPSKQNCDWKREIQKKLKLLNSETNDAILTLIQMNIDKNKSIDNTIFLKDSSKLLDENF